MIPIATPSARSTGATYVLGEMLKNGFIDQAAHDAAVASPLGTVPRQTPKFERVGGYFVEEVRRQLIDKFGETEQSGPYSVYSAGCGCAPRSIRRSSNMRRRRCRDGLLRYERGRGWSGPIGEARFAGDGWQQALLNTNIGLDYEDWRAAIVIARSGDAWRIGFEDGTTGALPEYAARMPVRNRGGEAFSALAPGDIIAVAPKAAPLRSAASPRSRAGWWSRIRAPAACWRCRAGSIRGSRRSTAPPRRSASRDRRSSRSSMPPRSSRG